ncbi:MAG: polysaccharide deacetylase family protein [Candidatus Bathyarchaeota archaeon]
MLENPGLRRHLRELAYLVWRLPLFFFARSWLQRTHFTVIHYHRMSPERFKEHLEYLTRKYTVIPMRVVEEALTRPSEPLPVNSLVITFDDGWKSNYELLHVIREHDCPVTIFLSTGLLGTNRSPGSRVLYDDFHLDEDLLEAIIRGSSTDASNLTEPSVTEEERTILSADEVREMKELVDFQSHGVNHHVSTALPVDLLRYELRESKRFIEDLTGREVYAFAYPYNVAGRKEAEAVAEAGYRIARVGQRKLNSMTADRYMLNSVPVVRDCSVPELEKNLELAKMKTVIHWALQWLQ